jgi:putative phage-type endonuclease
MTDIIQGTAEWQQLRLGKVTASRVADILSKTKSGYSTSRGNYLIELALQRVTGTVEESFTNATMQWGTDNEPYARMAYEAENNLFVEQVAFVDHPSINWFGCSPDGLVVSDGLVEIKCPNSATHWATVKSKEVPTKYIYQIQSQIACTQRDWNDFVSYDPRMPEKSKLFVQRVYRDEKIISEIESAVKQFLEEVEKEVELMKGNQS